MSEANSRRGWSGALLGVAILPPAIASWFGLTAAAEQLGLSGAWAVTAPLSLDAAAVYVAVLALRDTESGDSAGTNRALTWLYVAGSAALNAWWGFSREGVAAAVFFAAMSVSVAVLWDRTLRQVRRGVLRDRGAVAVPAPRFRAARWLVAPSETAAAWRHAIVEGVSSPDAAVAAIRGVTDQCATVGASTADTAALEAGPEPVPVLPPVVTSKARFVRELRDELPELDPAGLSEAARERGVIVDAHYVAGILARARAAEEKAVRAVTSIRHAG